LFVFKQFVVKIVFVAVVYDKKIKKGKKVKLFFIRLSFCLIGWKKVKETK